ncbi:hypothetical protein L596_029394 [Steinernema carpocapsae]|uniref:Uncharacterized protein n=1 Tax=Steinernema carpocapsae TaxID=34508 RepID=A0A4U5LUI0_STECR|nr:hypothetical protein L596_029394 [Steinernema carpocapsae]
MTWMESLLTITSPSITLADPMSQLEKPLSIPKARLMSSILLSSDYPAPESTKDPSMRLEELMTWMESLLTIMSPSITLADLMSQLEKPLKKPKLRLMSSILLQEFMAVQKSPAHLDYPSSGVYEGPINETGRAHDWMESLLTITSPSDEPTDKITEQPIEKEERERGPGLGSRFTGLFKKSPAYLTIPAPESTKDPSMRLEELMTWMESLLTITLRLSLWQI